MLKRYLDLNYILHISKISVINFLNLYDIIVIRMVRNHCNKRLSLNNKHFMLYNLNKHFYTLLHKARINMKEQKNTQNKYGQKRDQI